MAAFLAASAAAGCAGALHPPPAPDEGRQYLEVMDRLRLAYERGDRKAFLSLVDPDFEPDPTGLEQSLIDASLRFHDVRLTWTEGRRSHGTGRLAVAVAWSRSRTSRDGNELQRHDGEAVLVLRVLEEGYKLLRIEGESPFEL